MNKIETVQPKKWVTKYELPDGGGFIEFPMTDKEIQEAIAFKKNIVIM